METKMNQIIHGDCSEKLKELEGDSIDSVVTDPPYGYSFMGKAWDKALPSVEIWKETLRVLKPGGFAFVMSAPRSDVCSRMSLRLEEAGFKTDFTPIYWTYASGFPKAMNIGKMVDKRGGQYLETNKFAEYIKSQRELVGISLKDLNKEFGYVAGCTWWESQGNSFRIPNNEDYLKLKEFLNLDDRYDHLVGVVGEKIGEGVRGNAGFSNESVPRPWKERIGEQFNIHALATKQAKALDGSYGGFQPKPAVEVIIVAMKPLSEKTYVDQALKNGKGITWLDSVRIPTDESWEGLRLTQLGGMNDDGWQPKPTPFKTHENGRYPANLLVSDDVLGEHSKYFSLDKWAENLPFLAVAKASKSEKSKGLDEFEEKQSTGGGGGVGDYLEDVNSASGKYGSEKSVSRNHHPTVKPLKLMSYLITLGSRPNDMILDPFCGSGTTCIAAKELGRNYIGIEREAEYVVIAEARIRAVIPTLL